MMGLSLAPITGKLVAQLVDSETSSLDISSLNPTRFN
jgi:glycine/D-amino acid oxidase-like deaminating enzyme